MTREILGWSVVAIIAAVGLAFLLGLYCWVTGSDNPLDEDADGEGFGRVASRPGSTRFAPGTGCAVSALTGDDPSRGAAFDSSSHSRSPEP